MSHPNDELSDDDFDTGDPLHDLLMRFIALSEIYHHIAADNPPDKAKLYKEVANNIDNCLAPYAGRHTKRHKDSAT